MRISNHESANADAYERFIRPIEDRMLRSIGRIVRNVDRAEDALQDVMAKIWSVRQRLETHPNPTAYVLSVCITVALDSLRLSELREETQRSITIKEPSRASPVERFDHLGPIWQADGRTAQLADPGGVLDGHGPVFNLGERVEAYSNPLWVALLALAAALGFPLERSAVILGLILAATGLLAAIDGTRRLYGVQPIFFPLGALLAVWPLRRRGLLRGMLPAIYLAVVLEVGKIPIADRFMDVTHILIQSAGAALGFLLVRRMGYTVNGELLDNR